MLRRYQERELVSDFNGFYLGHEERESPSLMLCTHLYRFFEDINKEGWQIPVVWVERGESQGSTQNTE